MTDTPKKLGQYTILRPLGAGGMADVYEALDEQLQRHVAIKVLPLEFARSAERVSRFDREVLATAKLNHPNIITVYDVGNDQGYAYYTMELLPGGSLKNKINEGLSQQEVLDITKQITSALAYAHSQNFVHRDLKPDNILFDAYDRAIVTDFGIAKLLGNDTTQLGLSLGTPYYMSPEQALAKSIDGRSDLYSLGVLIYRMLTGLPLFDAEDSQGICIKHIQEPPPPLPAAFSAFQPILEKLLAKAPADRYTDANELLTALNKVNITNPDATLHMSDADETVVSVATPYETSETLVHQHESKAQRPNLQSPKSPNKKLPVMALSIICLLIFLAGGIYFSMLKFMDSSSPDSEFSQNDQLDDSEKFGILFLESDPLGAEVSFDGEVLGITPLTLENIPAGAQTLTLSKRYFEPKEFSVKLIENKLVKHSEKLVRGSGALSILSTPNFATVTIDGKQHSGTTPLSIDKITAGKYQVSVQKDDALFNSEVEVLAGENKVVRASLSKGELIAFNDEWLTSAALLEAAKRNLESGHYALPVEGSALEKYRILLNAKLGHEKEASEGVNVVMAKLESYVNELIKRKNFNEASSTLTFIEKNIPEFKPLQTLKLKVTEEANEAEAEIRQKAYLNEYKSIEKLIKNQEFGKAESALNQLVSRYPKEERNKTLTLSLKQAKTLYFETVTQFSGEFASHPGASLQRADGNTVTVPPFKIGLKEVTFDQWDACVAEGACSQDPSDEGWGRGARPVINVSLAEINTQFLPWLIRKTGVQYRLPTELEWQIAAAAENGKYFWGEAPLANSANGSQVFGWPSDGYDNSTAPTGSYKKNSLGLFDMHGNVAEWTASCWSEEVRFALTTEPSCSRAVVKGGSWRSGSKYLEAGERVQASINQRSNDRGFRLVRVQ